MSAVPQLQPDPSCPVPPAPSLATGGPPSTGPRPLPNKGRSRQAKAAHATAQAAAQAAAKRAVALVRSGQLQAAAAAFGQATQLAPEVSQYWGSLAGVQRGLGQDEAALHSARQACRLDPGNVLANRLQAELLLDRRLPGQAAAVLQALPPGSRRDARWQLVLGRVQAALGRHGQAAQSLLAALALDPRLAEAHQQLGFAMFNLRHYGQAAQCLRTATLLDGGQAGSAVFAAHYAAWACDWDAVDDDVQRLRQALSRLIGDEEASARAAGLNPFCLLAMEDDAPLHLHAARLQAQRLARELRHQVGAQAPAGEAHAQARAALAGGRIRLGLMSGDFRTHATSMLLVQTLERLDRSRFEVLLYSHGPDDGSALRQRLQAAADQFIDTRDIDLVQQARRIRDDGVTVLVDMSGYTQNSRVALMSLRPAPVQVNWLAYPGTLGADWVDYLIGDPVLTPLALAGDYAEHIAQLPLCYEPTDTQREHPDTHWSRADAGLPEQAFVYACFNQSYKITAPVFERWCRILQQVPGSVLWLLVPQADIQAALRRQAEARGVDPGRLVFAPFVDPSTHLQRLPLADVFLDTYPYGAHTTCSDALWMGLPVLTQRGRSFASRVAASLLRAVGLPELAVDDADDYETLAVRLAEDREALDAVRAHLQQGRLQLPLFDNQRFTLELQALLERMVARWQQGLAPAALPAEPLSQQA